MKTNSLKKVFNTQSLNGKLVKLNEEQANTFVDYVRDESKLLKATRFVKMQKPIKTIAKLFAQGRFLQPGKSGVALGSDKYQQAQTETIDLRSKMVRGAIFITDEELQDNIEGESFKDTFMRLVARKVSNELEEIGIYSRNLGEDNPLSTLDQFDGFKYRMIKDGNVLDASDSGKYSDRLVKKKKFADAMKMLKTKYRQGCQFLCPSDVMIDYGLQFDTVADSAVRAELRSQIIGKPLIEVPLMRVDEPVIQSAGATTVNGAVTADGSTTVVTVADASGISNSDYIVINSGLANEKTYQVVSKSTNDLNLDRPVEYDLESGDTVNVATKDGADTILGNPLNMIYGIQTGEGAIQFETERLASLGYTYHFKMRLDFQLENPEATVIITNLKVE